MRSSLTISLSLARVVLALHYCPIPSILYVYSEYFVECSGSDTAKETFEVMASRKKEEKIVACVRLDPDEERLLQTRAAQAGLDRSGIIYRYIMEGLHREDVADKILVRLAELEEKVEAGSDRVIEIHMRMFKDGTDRIIEVLARMFKVGMLQAAKFDRSGVGGFPKSDELNRFVDQKIINR